MILLVKVRKEGVIREGMMFLRVKQCAPQHSGIE